MRKICLTVVGLYLMLLHAFSQVSSSDSSTFKSRALKVDEINLVSSYYWQNGDHSPITGGIGTEQGTDFSNGLDITFVGWDGQGRKNRLTAGLGVDYHTAASQAYVSQTGASKTYGTRIYPWVNWEIANDKKGSTFGLGAYYSGEYNYKSIGMDAAFSKKNHSNGQFGVKLTGYFDQVKMIYPSELIPVDTVAATSTSTADSVTIITTASGRTVELSSGGTVVGESKSGKKNIPSSPRNSYSASFNFSQIINTRLQVGILMDLVYQTGYLGLPFHRVYFVDGTVHVESLPAQRFKLPIGLRVNYFLGDDIILRGYYRFYIDDWGIKSNTLGLEVPVKISPFISVSPFYRFYIQTASRYFAPYEMHTIRDSYYTSNYALSAFTSQFYGVGLRLAPPKGILFQGFSNLEIRYGHYTQTTDLVSNIVSLALQFK
jgi:Protein of unknown function (DUF3570)